MAIGVDYIIRLKDRFSKKVAVANKSVDKFDQRIKSTKKIVGGLAAGFGVAFAGRLLIGGINKSIDAFNQQEQAIAQVRQGILSTGGIAGKTLDDITASAEKFQNKTIFGDETILQGVSAQLLTFTNITGKAFDRTQQAVLDVTTRLFGADATAESLKSTSIQLGKALNDPIKNLSALSRSGIQFTEQQKALIKKFQETNQLGKAQALILGELEKQYGGSAEAARKAGTGGIKALKNRLGDITEEIGRNTIKSIGSAVSIFADLSDMGQRFVQQPIASELRIQQTGFNRLSKEIGKASVSFDKKLELIEEAQKIYPEFLANVTDEADLQARLAEDTRRGNEFLKQQIEIKKVRAKVSFQEQQLDKAISDANEFQRKADELATTQTEQRKFGTRSAFATKYINLLDDIGANVLLKSVGIGTDKQIKKINEAAIKGADKFAEAQQKAIARSQKELDKLTESFSKDFGGGIGGGIQKGLKDAGITKITSAAPKVFNINIEKLVEMLNINTTTLTEGLEQTKAAVIEALLTGISDSQIGIR